MRTTLAVLCSWTLLGLCGCSGNRTGGMDGGPCAPAEFACADGLDDDCDGAVDCNDADCATDSACVTGCGSCDDGNVCTVDTCGPAGGCVHTVDCNLAACATDPTCATCVTPCGTGCCAAGESCCDAPGAAPSCYASACLSCCMPGPCVPAVPTESATLCRNGLDDDCDMLVDCADPDCAAIAESNGSGTLCHNGLDDDCDGLADCYDVDCYCSCNSCDDGNPCTADFCLPADGCLNAFDCTSPACTDPACGRCTANEVGLCADGADNDCDGRVDCADSDCFRVCP